MPLQAQSHLPIPSKDLLSWCYDNREGYDQDKPIYIDTATSQSLCANQVYQYIRQLVAGFQAIGLKKGDVVCIHSFNQLFYPVLVQGIIGAGGVFLGTNPSYTPYELEHAILVSKAKFLIAEPELLRAPKEVAQKLNIPNSNILLFSDSGVDAHASWRSLLNHGSRDWVQLDGDAAKNTTAFLMFSSGTTGLPKAAQLSHYNLIAEHILVHENPDHPSPFPISMLACLPFFHAACARTYTENQRARPTWIRLLMAWGTAYTHVSSLRAGLPSHVMRRFDPWGFLDAIFKFKTTRLMLVPPMVVALINAARQDEGRVIRSLQSVRSVVGGAAPLDAETQGRLQKLLPPEGIFTQLWAMTETSCVATYFYPPEKDDTGSVGRFIPNLDAKLVDDDGNEVGPFDVRGELCVRGPTVIRGYLDNPKANAESWDSDGFFHTGDIAMCDGRTKLWYIVDRKKELIKVRGFQVAPAELEGVLLGHPSVQDAAVIGVQYGEAGELPRAYVIKHEGAHLSEEDVRMWVKERLAGYKQLAGGVKFVDSIPKTASGKILKRVLKESLRQEKGLPTKL